MTLGLVNAGGLRSNEESAWRPKPARGTVGATLGRVLFEILLAASRRRSGAAFVRPPDRFTSARYAPAIGLVTVQKGAIHFRTARAQVAGWLRRIDRWARNPTRPITRTARRSSRSTGSTWTR
jgi:hypothetical protein